MTARLELLGSEKVTNISTSKINTLVSEVHWRHLKLNWNSSHSHSITHPTMHLRNLEKKRKKVKLTITKKKKKEKKLQRRGTKYRTRIILPGRMVLWHAVSSTWPECSETSNTALRNVDFSLHQQCRGSTNMLISAPSKGGGAWETREECWAPSNCCQDMPTASQPAST